MANARRAPGQRHWEIRTFPSDCKKVSFLTKADAKRWIKKKRGQAGFSSKHAYHCDKCNGWHTSRFAEALLHGKKVSSVEDNGNTTPDLVESDPDGSGGSDGMGIELA